MKKFVLLCDGYPTAVSHSCFKLEQLAKEKKLPTPWAYRLVEDADAEVSDQTPLPTALAAR